jgi:hypothetical protein
VNSLKKYVLATCCATRFPFKIHFCCAPVTSPRSDFQVLCPDWASLQASVDASLSTLPAFFILLGAGGLSGDCCAVFYSISDFLQVAHAELRQVDLFALLVLEFLQVAHAERRQVDLFPLLVFGVGACSLFPNGSLSARHCSAFFVFPVRASRPARFKF